MTADEKICARSVFGGISSLAHNGDIQPAAREIHGAQGGRVSIIGSHVCYTITGHQSVKVDNPVTSSLYVTTIPEQNPRGFILCDDDRGKKPAQSRVGFIFCLFFYGIHAPPIEIIRYHRFINTRYTRDNVTN